MKTSMSDLITEAVNEAQEGTHRCVYCSRGFIKETTLIAHQCEPKRRA